MKNECAFALAFALMYEVSLSCFVFCRFSCFVEFKQKLRVYDVEKDGIHVAVLCANCEDCKCKGVDAVSLWLVVVDVGLFIMAL